MKTNDDFMLICSILAAAILRVYSANVESSI